MSRYYKVVTDGNVFRITARNYGGDDAFVRKPESGVAIEFSTKESANAYIHEYLSMAGWKDA